MLPCGHTFHSSCIMTNVIRAGSLQCPNCRSTIVVDDKKDEEESDAESDSSRFDEKIKAVAERLRRKLSRPAAIGLLWNFSLPTALGFEVLTNLSNKHLFLMLAEELIYETDDEGEGQD